MLDGIGGEIAAEEDSGLIGLESKWFGVGEFLIGAGKRGDSGVVAAADVPAVENAEFEFGNGWSGLDGLDGGAEAVNGDSIDERGQFLSGGHVCSFPLRPWARCSGAKCVRVTRQ